MFWGNAHILIFVMLFAPSFASANLQYFGLPKSATEDQLVDAFNEKGRTASTQQEQKELMDNYRAALEQIRNPQWGPHEIRLQEFRASSERNLRAAVQPFVNEILMHIGPNETVDGTPIAQNKAKLLNFMKGATTHYLSGQPTASEVIELLQYVDSNLKSPHIAEFAPRHLHPAPLRRYITYAMRRTDNPQELQWLFERLVEDNLRTNTIIRQYTDDVKNGEVRSTHDKHRGSDAEFEREGFLNIPNSRELKDAYRRNLTKNLELVEKRFREIGISPTNGIVQPVMDALRGDLPQEVRFHILDNIENKENYLGRLITELRSAPKGLEHSENPTTEERILLNESRLREEYTEYARNFLEESDYTRERYRAQYTGLWAWIQSVRGKIDPCHRALGLMAHQVHRALRRQ